MDSHEHDDGDKSLGEWIRDLETRVRNLEHRMYMGMGALAVLNFIRACI